MSTNWKEAARRFAKRARNHRHNWREMSRENLAARRALDACANCLELQADRESGEAHVTASVMSALMASMAQGARRVLNGGSYDDIDERTKRL